MGGGASSPKKADRSYKLSDMEQRKIFWAMPSWCFDDYVVNDAAMELANNSWKFAMSGESQPFITAKSKEPSITPLVFFYNQFYYFLFELLPDVKPLFKRGMKAQGRMLANVIKYIVTSMRESDEAIVRHSLEHLARVHNTIGIVADQYSVMGMCLIHTIRICTGKDYWTQDIHNAWVNIYSKMMSIIIPVVISGEKDGDNTTMDVASLRQVEYYKGVNLNADGDKVDENAIRAKAQRKQKTGGGSCPVVPSLRNGSASMGGCPAMKQAAADAEKDEELSVTLDRHFSQTAATHVQELAREASERAQKDKYQILSRVLELAARVEVLLVSAQMRDPGIDGGKLPRGMVTGAQLLKLMRAHNLVADENGAKVAAGYFLQMQLMSAVNLANQSLTCSVNAPVGQFAPEAVYSFAAQSLQPIAVGKEKETEESQVSRSTSDSNEFMPRCILPSAGLIPPDGILNALQPGTPSLEAQEAAEAEAQVDTEPNTRAASSTLPI